MNFGNREYAGTGCECHSIMSLSLNTDRPIIATIKCKKHEAEAS